MRPEAWINILTTHETIYSKRPVLLSLSKRNIADTTTFPSQDYREFNFFPLILIFPCFDFDNSVEVAIGDSSKAFHIMESQSTNTRYHRPLLLHAIGVSILTIVHKIYQRAEHCHGPIGSLAQKLAALASPITHTIIHQWLAILSYTNEQILAVESVIETLFPPSEYIFDKMDRFVSIAETLPMKVDLVVDQLLAVVHQVPLFSWSSTYLSAGLNLLASILVGREYEDVKEKEIVIDVNSDKPANKGPNVEGPQCSVSDKHVAKPNLMEDWSIFNDTQQVEHVKKPNLIPHMEGVEHIGVRNLIKKWSSLEYDTRRMKQVGKPNSTSHDHKRAKHVEKLNSIERVSILDDIQHAEPKLMNDEKSCISNDTHVRHVTATCHEILDESEEIAMKEEIGEEGQKNCMGGTQGHSDAHKRCHEEVNLKDDPILELFNAGWHMKRVRKRGP